MSKLAYGPPSRHILSSSGPPAYPLHRYSTTYSSHHGRAREGVEEAPLRHRGTGYGSNFRPAVYYSSALDAVDNPALSKLLVDNYVSLTQRDYVGYVGPDGRDKFPAKVHSGWSGYAHNVPKTVPTTAQVRGVHVDTAREGTVPTLPRHQTLLHTQRPKDPVASENAGHGPRSMSTEYHTKFPRQPFREEGLSGSLHSRQEESGFTHALNIEPVTFRPQENFAGVLPGNKTWRPTGRSIMRVDFRAPAYMKGTERLPAVTSKADPKNGYVKGNQAMADVQPKASEMVGYTNAEQLHPTVLRRVKREDPAEYTIVTHPYQYSSLTQRSFQGVQPREEGRKQVGRKELTGFSENNEPMVEPSDRDTTRFSTHYQSRFSGPSPASYHSMVPSGRPGVQPALHNGFSKSTQVHRFGTATGVRLGEMHPYVARSLLRRHPYYNDNTHHKANTL